MDLLLFTPSAEIRSRIEGAVARAHHVVRTVTSVGEAVRAIAKHAFPAVFVGFGPNGDNTLYGRLRAAPGEPRPILVAIMEGASAVDMKAALDAGADDVLATGDDAELDARLAVIERRARERAHLVPVQAMAKGLAHHIRNPLNSAGLQLEIALRAIFIADVAAMRTALGAVKRDLDRIAHLATALVASAEAHRPARRETDVVAVLRAAIVRAREDLGATSADVRLIAPESPLVAHVDPVRVEAAIVSMIRNAIEALTESGQVVLRIEANATDFRVQVENTGNAPPRGLDPFVPFATTKASALGLGLPAARRIALDHGGDIHLGRDADRTIATIAFPFEAPATH